MTVAYEVAPYTSVSTMHPPAAIDSLALEIEDRTRTCISCIFIQRYAEYRGILPSQDIFRCVKSDDYLTYHDTLTDGTTSTTSTGG
jgi:hypothetical protein